MNGEPAKFYHTKGELFITGRNFWNSEYALLGLIKTTKLTLPPVYTDCLLGFPEVSPTFMKLSKE